MSTVLIIEDSEEMREMLAAFIARLGYDVKEARNGLDGIKMAQALRPSLIVLDLMMPVASGDFTLGFIRSTESLKHIPVIVTSAHPQAQSIAEKLDAKCLPKPFSIMELRSMIEEFELPS